MSDWSSLASKLWSGFQETDFYKDTTSRLLSWSESQKDNFLKFLEDEYERRFPNKTKPDSAAYGSGSGSGSQNTSNYDNLPINIKIQNLVDELGSGMFEEYEHSANYCGSGSGNSLSIDPVIDGDRIGIDLDWNGWNMKALAKFNIDTDLLNTKVAFKELKLDASKNIDGKELEIYANQGLNKEGLLSTLFNGNFKFGASITGKLKSCVSNIANLIKEYKLQLEYNRMKNTFDDKFGNKFSTKTWNITFSAIFNF